MRTTTYRQCQLRRGDTITVSYLPGKYAVQGECLRLRRGEQWTDGWIVETVGLEIAANLVEERSQLHRRAHLATGVPKGTFRESLMARRLD